jgi:flagellar biosynthesis/type III secretory pathway chaperone
MLLSNNTVFIQEYSDFKSQIDKIENQSTKEQLQNLLNKLLVEVQSLDRRHEELIINPRMPSSVLDHKTNISELRKKIKTKIEDCKKAGLIK